MIKRRHIRVASAFLQFHDRGHLPIPDRQQTVHPERFSSSLPLSLHFRCAVSFAAAVSLGHDESLIVFLGENDERQYLYPEAFHDGFFRFSVGIEDAEDIIVDLQQALEQEGLL